MITTTTTKREIRKMNDATKEMGIMEGQLPAKASNERDLASESSRTGLTTERLRDKRGFSAPDQTVTTSSTEIVIGARSNTSIRFQHPFFANAPSVVLPAQKFPVCSPTRSERKQRFSRMEGDVLGVEGTSLTGRRSRSGLGRSDDMMRSTVKVPVRWKGAMLKKGRSDAEEWKERC